MKLKVEECKELSEVEIIIKCPEKNTHIDQLVAAINTHFTNLLGKRDGENIIINLENIYYFEAVENRVYAYEAESVYEVPYKIQELVDSLGSTSFLQSSRTMILNISKVSKIKSLVNGRIMAELDNGEKTIITRVYAQDLKKRIKQEVKK
ncbi:MAG: LytTR family transcriptional regulator DNA-binding domain-containing protein [Bacilli bacterium]|jgi:DNA-binding LytR/AlgR family response regulator|nr:LytTR family transcriptional regulator DNA-binding domain-containing protein [Bacilli bacterium]